MDISNLIERSGAIRKFYSLPDLSIKDWAFLMSISSFRSIKKGDVFIKAGTVSEELGFIIKGSFRFFYEKEDVEKTAYFVFENQIMASFEGILEKAPSKTTIQALEDGEIFVIDYNKMRKMYHTSSKFENIGRLIGEYYILMLHNQLSSFLLDTPEERYLKLVENNADLLNKVPLQYIASYIGVTPVSLSRIRKRIISK
ncbi:MAG: Crp/Fnr family transcriptional regulator [Chitinophagales bacterium]|jgi:CRP-like cAMP-binding protein|nr:Crp/Fnr family transcriptional regulator [Chitinophagales bacterium]